MIGTRIGVMARAPLVDRVRSRLLEVHGARWVCGLYAAMLRDTLDGLQSIEATRYVVFVAPLPGDSDPRPALDVVGRHAPAPWEVVGQQGADLGARIKHAIGELSEGGARALLVGSDAPTFPTEPLAEALSADDDVILGPSSDGTYYLVGTKSGDLRLFDDVPWKTSALLGATRTRCRELGLSMREIAPSYRVDDPSDVYELLDELRKHPERAPRTAQFIVTNG